MTWRERLTDEVLRKAIAAYLPFMHLSVRRHQDLEPMRVVLLTVLEGAEPPTCASCRHWLPSSRAADFRAQCNMGVSGATPEKASHHPYPITRRDFGCTLHSAPEAV